MKTNKLRFIVFLLMFSMVALACGGDTTVEETTEAPEAEAPKETLASPATTSPPPVVLTVWAEAKIAEAIEPTLAAYEEAAGVDVQVAVYDFGAIRADVQTAAPAGEGPDVYLVVHDWMGELVKNGVAEPIDLGPLADEFVDVALDAYNLGGQTYGLPYFTEAMALYYNTDLVSDPISDFSELEASCASAGTEYCFGTPAGDAYANHYWYASGNGNIFEFGTSGFDPNNVGLDNSDSIAGVTLLDSYVKSGLVETLGWGDMVTAFNDGALPYMVQGPWAINDVTVPYSVVQIPAVNGNPGSPFIGVRGAVVNPFSENKVLATSFVLDYLSQDAVQEAMYIAEGRAPAKKALLESARNNPITAGFLNSALNGIPMPNIPEMANVWGAVGSAMGVIYNQDYGTNEETGITINSAEEAMKLAAQQVRDAIAGG